VSNSFVIFFGSALAHVRRMMKARSSDVHSSLLKRRCRPFSRRVRLQRISATIAVETQMEQFAKKACIAALAKIASKYSYRL